MPVKLIRDFPAVKRTTSVWLTDEELTSLQRAVDDDSLMASEAGINISRSDGPFTVTIDLCAEQRNLDNPESVKQTLRSAVKNEVEQLDMVDGECGIAFVPDPEDGLTRAPGYDRYFFQLQIKGNWKFDERRETIGSD